MQCFVHFHFKMCFSPQRRAIFRHLNFKKWPEHAVFCAFSLENVLLATAACNFSTSELQKVVRSWLVLYIFTSKCASRHSGVQFLISPLTTWLRTRRFTEPTFRLTRHTNHWKNTAFRDFSNIWRGCIFFLLTFAQLHLLSSDSTFSSDFTFFWLYFISSAFHLCFSTLHIVGSLLFKLPSISLTILLVPFLGRLSDPFKGFQIVTSNVWGSKGHELNHLVSTLHQFHSLGWCLTGTSHHFPDQTFVSSSPWLPCRAMWIVKMV